MQSGFAALAMGVAMGVATVAVAEPAIHQMSDLKIAATIPLSKGADWVAITKDRVWIGSKTPFAVSEIDPVTNQVTATIELPGNPCGGLAADADSLWVPLCGSTPQLAQIDLKKKILARVLKIGPGASEGGITAGAGSVWLITDKTGSLARIDPVSGTIAQTIQLPAGSYNPVFNSGRIWVSRADGAELTVVDAKTATVVDHVAIGPHPRFLTSGGGAVWTLNQEDGSVSRIDIANPQSVSAIPLRIPGFGGDIAFGDGRVWATLMKTPLSVVDAANSNILCQWQGAGGDSLGVGHGAVWLTNLREGTVSRINLSDLPADCNVAK